MGGEKSGQRMMKYILLVLCSFACKKMEYSPHQQFDSDTPRGVNQQNIQKLQSIPNDDNVIRFVLTGDSQRFYDEAVPLVNKINDMKKIDFVLLAGDITDFGLLQEYEWVHRIFGKLYVPYIAVIGNHDMVANGENIYQSFYGPIDFSFVYDSVKFICHNTNSREFNFTGNVPDMNWLKQELKSEAGVKSYIAVSHVPPFSEDFDPALVSDYYQLFRYTPGFLASLHGHTHEGGYLQHQPESIPYINCDAVNRKKFALCEITKGEFTYSIIQY